MRSGKTTINIHIKLFIFTLFLPAVVLAEQLPAPETLLKEMTAALQQLNYDGVFIYKRGRSMDTMRVIHKADAINGSRERLVSLSGTPREVLRNNKSVTCIFPDKQLVMVEKSHSREMLKSHVPDSVTDINKLYQVNISGHGRIAGHEAWSVNISPIDQYRYGYQLWVAKDSKLLLKSTLRNKSGYPLEEIVFTKLDVLNDIPEQNLKASVSATNFTWKHSADRLRSNDRQNVPWRLNWIPPGFTLQSYERHSTSSASDSEHLVLTDGLAVVSVFIEKARSTDNINGPAKIGAVNAFARLMNGYTITAIGEVPQTTVQRMATSVASLR